MQIRTPTNNQYQRRRKRESAYVPEQRVMKVPFDTPLAFRELDGRAICPICGLTQRVPKKSRFITQDGDDIFLCGKGKDCLDDKGRPLGCGCRFILPVESDGRRIEREHLYQESQEEDAPLC